VLGSLWGSHGAVSPELEIFLVRHAESVVPTPGGPDEQTRPLTARGQRQAEELADVLAGVGPRAVVCSPYRRAVQTVQPTADRIGLPVIVVEGLREWTSGLAPTPEWRGHYRRCWADPDYALPGAERHREAQARALATMDELVARYGPEGGAVVAGSHGTLISLALAGLGAPVDEAFWLAMPMPAVYRLVVSSTGGWRGMHGPGLP
jgi:2,3-bisphosphoglycerate-dependent phosphoglycerate mutase